MRTTTRSATQQEPSTTDTVRTYLKEIGRTPLLRQEEEVTLGKQVQAMLKLQETKQALIDRQGRETSQEAWAQAVGLTVPQLNSILLRGERARQRMIQANLRLVVNVAKKYQNRGMELLDLVQEGSIGLGRAVEKFDPTRGYKFSTYAYWWIRQSVSRAVAEKSRTIRLPIHVTEKLNKIKKARRSIYQDQGPTPTLAEVAEAVEMDPRQLNHLQTVIRQPLSLDLRVGEQDDLALGGLLEDPGAGPEQYAEQEDQREHLERLLAELTPQQREALTLRFGLNRRQGLTLAKVGERIGVS